MKAKFSNYLDSIAPGMKKLVRILRRDFPYVSVLSTDSTGIQLAVSQRSQSVSHSNLTTEQGNVVRVYRDGRYSEYAFNDFDPSDIEGLAEQIKKELSRQFSLLGSTRTKTYETKKLADEKKELRVEKEAEILPESCDIPGVLKEMKKISDAVVQADPCMREAYARASCTHISKMFLSSNRDLRQSYVICEGTVAAVGAKDGKMKIGYKGVSGCGGVEILREMKDLVKEVVQLTKDELNARPVVPGEYDVITSPEISGLIAHEAFGHGVEMDMFVKKRALGEEYIGKRVGSELVTMHEGALCAENVSSYAFDDEGTLAQDVVEIDRGILKTGVCDALSALRLGVQPTGNGKRQNFEHKAYTRMTNTVFDSGEDKLEDMIASIRHGYLLEGMQSGMEDPKHWGIQCILSIGYEIRDGRLTGKAVSPVVMTGYVPDLLGSITMRSADRRIDGNGYCGKGHKEYVKVSEGGPYLKAKARLG